MRKRLAVPTALLTLLALALLASGCSLNDSPANADTVASSPAPRSLAAETSQPARQEVEPASPRAVVPQIAFDGPPPTLTLSTAAVYQGGTLLITATGGSSGAITVFGRTTPMANVGGELVALVGFGTQDPPGTAYLTLDILNSQGQWDYVAKLITVVSTEWTVDYIIIPPAPPPDPNAPPPPPPPPDEGPLLPGIYAGITAKKWSGAWAAPLGDLRITGYFGEQRSFNGGPVQGHHGGTDFGADLGTPILSTNAGIVVLSGLYRIRGNIVVVDHGLGVFSLYGHMTERSVQVGDAVTRGQVLGLVGSTGLSTGAHLHWEISVFGVLVDGLRWLDGSQGF